MTRSKHALCLFTLLAAGAAGCVENDVSVSIDKFVAPQDDCTIDPEGLIQGDGTYDVRIAAQYDEGYSIFFAVTNNLPTRENVPVEVQAYYVQSYDVEIVPNNEDAQVLYSGGKSFSAATSTVRLAPGGTAAGSILAIQPGELDALAAQELDALVTVRLRPVMTRAEEQVVGAYASFPLRICTGCLVRPTAGIRACPLAEAVENAGCRFAADAPIVCCENTNTALGQTGLRCGVDAPFVP
jgi:hypothetical protein